MTTPEQLELDSLAGRLSRRFPELDATEVREVARSAFQRFEGARLRQFTLVLAEKSATDACRRMRASLRPPVLSMS